jgi:phenylpyruvate tautomerase PptA (4-oxalocrotonate tautomerase family)
MSIIIVPEEIAMPMIDVHLTEGAVPATSHGELARRLTHALLRWEGNPIASPYSENTAAFVHVLPQSSVHTAAQANASAVRVQVITPPGGLGRDGQIGFVDEATRAIADLAGDPTLAGRTWVILTEANEGGWGVAGFALGQAEFAALKGA